MRKSVSGLVAFVACVALGSAGSAAAQDRSLSGAARAARIAELGQSATSAGTKPMPAHAAAMDEALGRLDYPGLRGMMGVDTPAGALLMFNWTSAAVMKGANFPISYFYATDLWTLARVIEAAVADNPEAAIGLLERAQSLKEMSVLMAVHTLTLVRVDGERCADPAASAKHVADMERAMEAQWAWARTQPELLRTQIVDLAAAYEETTASVRAPDQWLCTTELAEMQAMAASNRTRDIPDDPATPGRDVGIEIDPADLFVSNRLWWGRLPLARARAKQASAERLGLTP